MRKELEGVFLSFGLGTACSLPFCIFGYTSPEPVLVDGYIVIQERGYTEISPQGNISGILGKVVLRDDNNDGTVDKKYGFVSTPNSIVKAEKKLTREDRNKFSGILGKLQE